MKLKNIIVICTLLILLSSTTVISSLSNNYSINNTKDPIYRNQEKEYFVKELNISEKNQINDELLNKLSERNKVDNDNLNKVIYLSKFTDESLRINSLNELLFIDKGFLDKYSRYSQIGSSYQENVQNQLNDYIWDIGAKSRFKAEFSPDKILKLFSDNDLESFIDSLKY